VHGRLGPTRAGFRGGALGSDWTRGLGLQERINPLMTRNWRTPLRGNGNVRRWGLAEGRRSPGCACEGCIRPLPFLLHHWLSLLPDHHDTHVPTTGPETPEAGDHGQKPLKPKARINPSSLPLVLHVLVTARKSTAKVHVNFTFHPCGPVCFSLIFFSQVI
jgi:hypothetical protein